MSPGLTTLAVVSEAPTSRLATLPPWTWDPYSPRAPMTLGWQIVSWAESGLLIQPNGPRAGKPFRATRDQLTFWLWWYAMDDDGQWLFNHGARRLAKGTGKSPFAGVHSLMEFLGPVRLARKDSRLPGGCEGKPVDMPWVQIAATAESQTANTMRMVRALAPKRSAIVREYSLDVGKTQLYKLPEGTLEAITSSATAAEGAESSFIVGDETENWLPANGGPALMSTLADNLAKSGARMLETANSWRPGEESAAEDTWDDWVAQEEGRLRGEARILYDARIAPPDTELADPDSLKSALEWVYDDCDWKRDENGQLDVRSIMERIYRKSARPDDSKRKYLNWPTAPQDAWLEQLTEWNRLHDPHNPVTVSDGDEIAMFFDGSKTTDASALLACRIEDGHVFSLGVWEPDPSHRSDDTVDPGLVDLAVRQAFDRFNVAAFFSDVREWESFALTEWPNRYRSDLELWATPASRPAQPIAWDMRAHTYEFAKAAEACHAEILEGSFTHDGDSAVARHVANARRQPYRDAITVRKESPVSRKKIDAAVCVIGVRMVRRMVLANPKRKRKKSGRAAFG